MLPIMSGSAAGKQYELMPDAQDALPKNLKTLHGGSLFEVPPGSNMFRAARASTSSLDEEETDNGVRAARNKSRYMPRIRPET